MEGYHRQRSLWKVVVENVPEPELGEVRAIVGGGLLDQYTELYAEVEMLEEICRDLEVSSTGADVLKPLRSPLTDPPVTKELLRAELQLLLFTIRERAARQGRDPDVAVSCYSPTVVSYALSRCSSPGSQRETPSRSSSRLSVGSCCEAEIEAMKNKLNVSSIEEVVSHLKSVLEDDYEALKREVQYLQECVEQMCLNPREADQPEPTVTELKEERRAILKDIKTESGDEPCSTAPSTRTRQSHNKGNCMVGSATQRLHCSPVLPSALSVEPLKTRLPKTIDQSFSPCLQRPVSSTAQTSDQIPRTQSWCSEHCLSPTQAPPKSRPAIGGIGGHQKQSKLSEVQRLSHSPTVSDTIQHQLHPKWTREGDSAKTLPVRIIVPCPPAAVKPTTRGHIAARRLRLSISPSAELLG